MDMICFLYRVISSSSKGAMSSSDKVLLLKSGGSGEFCFLLYGYVVSTRAALYPGCDAKRRSPGILWILSPRNETNCSAPRDIDNRDLAYIIGFIANNLNAGMVIDCRDLQLWMWVTQLTWTGRVIQEDLSLWAN